MFRTVVSILLSIGFFGIPKVLNATEAISEPYYFEQWYLDYNENFYIQNDIDTDANIHSRNALKQYTGKGVTIAIIDDGLDVTHEEINTSIIATYDIATGTTDVSQSGTHAHHGTAATGIIAADINTKGIAGVASKSRIIFLKYKENMSDSETIELFNKADELGADIINCSWGTYNVSQAVKETIQELAHNGREGKGTIIVFAVGNGNRDMGNDESAIPEVVAVGATDRDNTRTLYSDYGDNLDIMAPGGYEVGITTADPMGEDGMGVIDVDYLLANDPNLFFGTSASAPIITGAIALMLEKDSNLTRIEIDEILKSTSDKIGNTEYVNGRNRYYGYGKINLDQALGIENKDAPLPVSIIMYLLN